MSYNVNPLASKGVVHAHWMEDGRFWYRAVDESGVTYMLVDPATGTRAPAFDQVKLAAAMKAASNGATKDDAAHLTASGLAFSDNDGVLMLTYAGIPYRCELKSSHAVCKNLNPANAGPNTTEHAEKLPPLTLSPDKKLGAFHPRLESVGARHMPPAQRRSLPPTGSRTTAMLPTTPAGSIRTRPSCSGHRIRQRSPHSSRTSARPARCIWSRHQHHPKLEAWKYPLVGDKDVTMIERVVIDVATRKLVRLKMPPDQHRSTLCDDVACHGSTWATWSGAPTAHLAFVSTSRDHKQEWLRVADTSTGEVREVMGETAPKFYESGNGKINWHYLPKSNEILWFSERDDWGNLYLYDLATGQLKNQITHGPAM
jgi:dipeptidyl-peptidase-4